VVEAGDLAALASAAALVGGVLFAGMQVYSYERRRREQYTMEVLRGLQAPEVMRAARLLWEVPDGMPSDKFCAQPGVEEAFLTIATLFESIGYMVHRKLISLDVVIDTMGGVMPVHWTKGKRYVEDVRADGHPRFFEWFQWLVEEVQARSAEAPPKPAYLAHAAERR
jgi:hypothetical protein